MLAETWFSMFVCLGVVVVVGLIAWGELASIRRKRKTDRERCFTERPPQHYNCRCTTEPSDWSVRMEAAIAKLRTDQAVRQAEEKIREAQEKADAAIKWQREHPSAEYAREAAELDKWAREVLRKHGEKAVRRLRVLARAVVTKVSLGGDAEVRIVKVLDADALTAACMRDDELELIEVRRERS